MRIIDLHCDALYKMQESLHMNNKHLSFINAKQLDVNVEGLKAGEVFLQFFAIFIPPEVTSDRVWHYATEQISIFKNDILNQHPQMKQIKSWEEIAQLKEGEIGAILTLEGAEAFGNDLEKLHYLYEQGVLLIGLTWNHANLCADGVGEARGAGLTTLGKEVVRLNNEHNVFTDVSHLSENGFWDVMELAKYPIASHSNCKKICDHPRNLSDHQIEAMFHNGGMIHVTFYPEFISERKSVTISDLIKHIDHLCMLGGVKQIGFGSDFDGIDKYIVDLQNAASYQMLINELLKYYSEDEVKGFAYENFLNHLPIDKR